MSDGVTRAIMEATGYSVRGETAERAARAATRAVYEHHHCTEGVRIVDGDTIRQTREWVVVEDGEMRVLRLRVARGVLG